MRRSDRSRFAPGAWVFPGGAVEEEDTVSTGQIGDELLPLRVCAMRELFEETGILPGRNSEDLRQFRRDLLGGRVKFDDLFPDGWPSFEELVWTARWITPEGVPKRFDTWFFLTIVATDALAEPEDAECVDTLWIRPEEALKREKAGELALLFPTIRNLQAIATGATSEELLESRRNAVIQTTRPILIVNGNSRKIVLPEDDD